MNSDTDRDIWLDVLRGAAILLVVLGHALRGIDAAGLPTGPAFHAIDVRLYAVHVPLLFFVSGVLVASSLARHRMPAFVQGRIAAILWPMLLWTYVFLGIKLAAGPFQNDPIGWEALLASPVPGQLHLWFLWALFLMHMAAAVVWTVTPARLRRLSFVLLFALSLVGVTLALPPAVDHWAGMAIRNLPCFALGLVLGAWDVRGRRRPAIAAIAAVVALAAVMFAPEIRAITGFGPLPSLVACGGAWFSATLVLSFPRVARVLASLGVSAMAIYVLHTIFSAGMREALLSAGIAVTGIHVVLGVAAGLLCPVIARELMLRARLARPLALA